MYKGAKKFLNMHSHTLSSSLHTAAVDSSLLSDRIHSVLDFVDSSKSTLECWIYVAGCQIYVATGKFS